MKVCSVPKTLTLALYCRIHFSYGNVKSRSLIVNEMTNYCTI